MCTAITLQTLQGETFLGRTMDFSYEIQPHVYIVPNNYMWTNPLNNQTMRDTYRFIAMGQQLDGQLGFFDGVNEQGFAAAALYFAGYAQYDRRPAFPGAEQIASYDFLHYILGKCATMEDLRKLLDRTYIIGMADPVTQTVAPLHWIVMDKSKRCMVVEQTERGLELFYNTIGVMANSPGFQWQLTNLRNYMETSPTQTAESYWGTTLLTPFGQAGGTAPLPGGFTSPDRFVRTAYLKTHIPTPKDSAEGIVSCFRIMESVSIPKGAVTTVSNTYDYTKYTAFINTDKQQYFFRPYEDLQTYTTSLSLDTGASEQLTDLGSIQNPANFVKI